ncbi:MAG: nitroreductase family protein [Pseudomonadota bacterium]
MHARSADFLNVMRRRRTVRDFADTPVPQGIIENAIAAAATAPSGANMQPWHFVAVKDPLIKSQIRVAAEEEEKALYHGRASQEWLEALAPLGTDEHKPFLQTAPWLIAVFSQKYTIDSDGQKHKHYYTPESVGIATGMLITALHHARLVTLTHTPSPMNFLRTILKRPEHEKPFLLLVAGYPANDAKVPSIQKKPLSDILDIF